MKKSVTFSEENTIHNMFAWDFAYRNARLSNWQTFYLDRLRFDRRIKRSALLLDKILDHNHRQNIYTQRFVFHCDLIKD